MIAGFGIDIVEIARVKTAVGRWGDRLLQRVFTGHEVSYCLSKKDPYPHLAARFAAKEAMIKALSEASDRILSVREAGRDNSGRERDLMPALNYRDIEVVNEPSGRPRIRLARFPLDLDGEGSDMSIHLTLSHEKRYAVASVILEMKLENQI